MEPRSAPAPSPDKLERIGRYRIVRPLSKGGMALVYEARRESLAGVSPRVAIKLILPEFASSDGFQELFINEARLGASMHHQNLVGIQDFDRDGDKFFLVMEYVEGLTLRRVVTLCARHDIPIPLGVIAEIGRQCCDGLHYAHSAADEGGHHLGLVHRDVKPSNLILNPQGVVKVLDFGISKGRLMRERKGAVKGTWGYMAPEQSRGDDVGPQADVFGLATVLYELASRKALFDAAPDTRGGGKSPDEIRKLLMDDHACRMATQLDAVYAPLVPVLLRAFQRDPVARYQSAADFGRALSALLPDPITARDEVVAFYRKVDAVYHGKPLPSSRSGDRTSALPASSGAASSSIAAPSTGTGPSLVWIVLGAGLLTASAVAVVAIAVGLTGLSRWSGASVVQEADPFAAGGAPAGAIVAPAPPPAADEPAGPAGEGAPGEQVAPPPASRTEHVRLPPASTVPAPRGATASPKTSSEPTATAAKAPEEVSFSVDRRTPPPAPDPETSAAEPVVVKVPAPTEAPAPATSAAAEQPQGTGRMTISATPGSFEVYVDGKLVSRGPIAKQEFPAGHHTVMISSNDGRTKQFEVDLSDGQELRKIWDFDGGEFRR